jgi:hypothetical protein
VVVGVNGYERGGREQQGEGREDGMFGVVRE